MIGDGDEIALEPSTGGGLEVIVRMHRSDVSPPRPTRQLSTVSASS